MASRSDRLAISDSVAPSPKRQGAVSRPFSVALRVAEAPRRRAAATISLLADRQQLAHQLQPCRVRRVDRASPSRARPIANGRSIQRIGNIVAILGIGAGEFPAPALAHRLGEVALEIAEERKRRFRAPFLAHEQHRHHRRQQGDRQRRLDRLGGSAWHSSRSPSARLPIWSWFCRKLTKAVGGKLAAGLAARLARRDARTPRPDRQSPSRARARYRCSGARDSRCNSRGLRRSAAHARRGDSRRSIARDICRAADPRRRRAGCALLSSFSSTRWMWRPVSRGKLADGAAQLVQHRDLARLGDGVHGIEPQPVEAIFAQPVQRVLDREGAHLRHPVIDRAAPRRLRSVKNAGA